MQGFAVIPADVVLDTRLNINAKMVLLGLTLRVGRGPLVVSHADLAEDLGLSVSSVQRGLLALRDLGIISWEARSSTEGRMANVYSMSFLVGVEDLGPTDRAGSVTQTEGVGHTDRLPQQTVTQTDRRLEEVNTSSPLPPSRLVSPAKALEEAGLDTTEQKQFRRWLSDQGAKSPSGLIAYLHSNGQLAERIEDWRHHTPNNAPAVAGWMTAWTTEWTPPAEGAPR